MARLPRLVVPGLAHCVIQRGHNGQAVAADDADRQAYLRALRDAAASNGVAVHAYALLDDEVQLVLTPSTAPSLSRMMQALGRRYVSAYNARHGRSGTLWDGRFRAAIVEPGAWLLLALRWVDGQPGRTTAGHRTGGARDPLVVDPPELWQLGNTPFEREAAYAALLAQGVPAQEAQLLRSSTLGGWAIGSATHTARLATLTSRSLRPRKPGRPRRLPPTAD